MNDTEKLTALIEAVSTMRISQKAYFQAPWESPTKKQHLSDSKKAENEVDIMLDDLKSKQVKMEL